MDSFNEICSLSKAIIEKAEKAIIFPHKCNIVASTLSSHIDSIYNFESSERISNDNLEKLKNYLTALFKIVDDLSKDNFLWTFLQSNQPFLKIISDINNNMKKINSILRKIGFKSSFKLPEDDLYQDLDEISEYLQYNTQLLKSRQNEIEDYLKQIQETSTQSTENEITSNYNELNKYPQYILKPDDFKYTDDKALSDRNDIFDYYKGKMTKSDEKVTILKLKDNSIFKRLLSVLVLIKHPYVESFKGSYINEKGKIKIITNRNGKKLSDLLYCNNDSENFLQKGDRTILAFKIAEAMSYLHSRSIIHRNVNSSNIYITRNSESDINPIIVGFRNSRLIPTESTSFMSNINLIKQVQISQFRAPELDSGPYDEKVDVFAFAGILFELIEGHVPFRNKYRHEVLQLLDQGKRPEFTTKVPEPLMDLIEHCWMIQPNERFSFDQIINEMIQKRIVFPLDEEKRESIEKFYDKKKIKEDNKIKCLNAFNLIKKFIGQAFQYRFELLRIRSVLNTYQFCLKTPKYSKKEVINDDLLNDTDILNTEEKLSYEDNKLYEELYNNLYALQTIIYNLNRDSYENVVNSIVQSKLPKTKGLKKRKAPIETNVPDLNIVKVTNDITNLMDKIYNSMINLKFKNIEKYQEVNDDLVYDYRELRCYFSDFSYFSKKRKCHVPIFSDQLDEISSFLNEKKLDGDISKEAFHNRLKDLFSPFKKFEVNRDDYEKTQSRYFADGATSKVYRGIIKNQPNDNDIAIKELKNDEDNNEKTLALLRMEIGSLTLLQHKYIAKFIGYSLSEEDNSVWFISKYYKDGDLSNYIHSCKNSSPTEMTKIAFKIAEAMSFVHSKGRLHHDLKPSNIVMEGNDPKIIDFGYSEPIILCNNLQLGTYNYMAPEVMLQDKEDNIISNSISNSSSSGEFDIDRSKDTKYDSKSDVFSFGLILWEMYSNELPFVEFRNEKNVMKAIKSNIRPAFTKPIHDNFKDLIEKCWDQDPNIRPAFKEIVAQMINDRIMFPNSDELEINQFYDTEAKNISNILLRIEKTISFT